MDTANYERSVIGDVVQLTRTLDNDEGRSTHRLTITGADDVIKTTFADGEPAVTIVPGGKPDGWQARWRDEIAEPTRRPFQLGTDVLKRKAAPPQHEPDVLVGVEQLEPGGTWYSLVAPLFLPRGISVGFFLPWICQGNAMVAPISGDQDLFVTFNGSPTVVAASALGGTAIDRVSFASSSCWPWDNVVAFVRVFGFATGSGWFFMSGFGIP